MLTKTLALCAAIIIGSGPQVAVAQSVTEPKEFAATAASSNMFEIESSQLALEKASGEEVRAFAEQMVADHTAAGEKMKAAAAQDGITPPASMAEKEQAQLEQLQAADADAFDEAYVSAQAAAHDEAVALFEAFSESGEESALRAFAAETLPTLQEHQTSVHELTGDH